MTRTPKRSRSNSFLSHSRTAVAGAVIESNRVTMVTIASLDHILDIHRFSLTQQLSTHPYHHEGAWAMGRYLDSPWARPTSLKDAIQLIQGVTEASVEGANHGLQQLMNRLSVPLTTLAIRSMPQWPDSIEKRLESVKWHLQ